MGVGGKEKKQREQDQEKKRRRREWAFAALLAILPEVHSVPVVPWGLISLTVAVGVVIHLYVTHEKIEHDEPLEKAVGGLCIILAVVVLLKDPLYRKWRREQSRETSGVLQLPWFTSPSATRPLMELGCPDGFIGPLMSLPDPTHRYVWDFFQESQVLLTVKGGSPMLSMEMRDGRGRLIVQITDNHWHVPNDIGAIWDKNYNRDTLEVIDSRGRVALQVKLLPDRIKIQGEWHKEDGSGMRVVQPCRGTFSDPTFIPLRSFSDDPPLRIQERFRYPSIEHWAEEEW